MKFEATLAELIVGGAVVGHVTVHAAIKLPVEPRVGRSREKCRYRFGSVQGRPEQERR